MNSAAEILRREIEKNETISFARFMEIALYAPEAGFYERTRDIGRTGDFFTSVSVGSLFGELLAFQFAEWISDICAGDDARTAQIVEAGAHNGQLAADILRAMRANNASIFQKIEYWIIEPSESRRQWQQQTVTEFDTQVRWFENWESLPEGGVRGVIFSNELLDAMPVQVLRWDAERKCFCEIKVGCDGREFIWKMDEACAMQAAVAGISSELAEILPDGFLIEHSPAALDWWQQAASKLQTGKLLAIDYGLTEEEIFQPERGRGTLRAYSRHRVSDNVLANPGGQDITAHVNFTPLQKAGESAGLKTNALISQSKFLTEILQKIWRSKDGSREWNAQRTRQFQTLTHPEHLGRSFRLLIQER